MGHFPYNDLVNLNDLGFKIAFGVVQYKTDEMLHDPNYVRFEVAIVNKTR